MVAVLRQNYKFATRDDQSRRQTTTYSAGQRSRYSKPRPKTSPNFIIALAVIALGSVVILKAGADAQSSIITSDQAVVMADHIGPLKTGPKINEKQLSADINDIISGYPGLDIAVVYQDLTKGKFYNYGAVDKALVGASVSKLITAGLYLHEVDEGKRSLSDVAAGSSARSQIKLMIEQSDNAAWLALDKVLGSSNLDNYARSIGMAKYKHSSNTLTAKDVAVLLQKLYGGKLLTKASTDLLLGHMAAANYRGYIVSVLPAGTKSYHKVGFLPELIHDAAIVDNGKYPYILVIFTQAKPGNSYTGGAGLLQEITRTINTPYQKKQ